jgi:polar amino acid transport system substrate-binding protein/glutamate/aspartate transport system substrate-binding protein
MIGTPRLDVARWGKLALAAACAYLLAAGLVQTAAADDAATLERIKEKKEIRLGFREDAAPFSYVENGKPTGYSVAVCLEVANALQQDLKMPELTMAFVPVTAENRFDAVAKGAIDLLCEATSVTLKRRETMDFSIPTFVSGASLAIRPDGPTSMDATAGKKIGVLGGTTTQEDLNTTLKEENISADVVVVHSHDEGFDLLKKGDITAYFADRTILQERLRADPATSGLLLADNYLTIEPYALAMPIDHDFRLAVDRALSHLFRSGGMIKIFRGSFAAEAKPSELLKALSRMSGLPE